MRSWDLPFQINRNCEVGITDKVNIVIGVDFLALGQIWLTSNLQVNYSSLRGVGTLRHDAEIKLSIKIPSKTTLQCYG